MVVIWQQWHSFSHCMQGVNPFRGDLQLLLEVLERAVTMRVAVITDIGVSRSTAITAVPRAGIFLPLLPLPLGAGPHLLCF